MIEVDKLREMVVALQRFVADDDEVRIATQCLYPTNSAVRVTVRGGRERFMVSDDAGAVKEVTLSGVDARPSDRSILGLVKYQGLQVDKGAIFLPDVPLEGVGPAVTVVANASRDVAEWCFHAFRLRKGKRLKERLNDLLLSSFGQELKDDFSVAGKSTKQHRFDYAVVKDDRIILIDSVMRDAASINSRVVANLDVRQAENPKIEQHIIYDDAEDWRVSDLSLLSMAASLLPFSHAPGMVQRWRTYI